MSIKAPIADAKDAKDAKNPAETTYEEQKAELDALFASKDRASDDNRDDLMYCQKKAHNLPTSDRPNLPNSDDENQDAADNWFDHDHIPGYRSLAEGDK